jgi:hypothetical protein
VTSVPVLLYAFTATKTHWVAVSEIRGTLQLIVYCTGRPEFATSAVEEVLMSARESSLVSKMYKLKKSVMRFCSEAQVNRFMSQIPGGMTVWGVPRSRRGLQANWKTR